MTKTIDRTDTAVEFIVQLQTSEGIECGPWHDLPGQCDDLLEAVDKMEMHHYLMEHGTYPDAYMEKIKASPTMLALFDFAQSMRRQILADRKRDGGKSRMRIVQRSYVVHITEEVVDPPTSVKYGKQS